MELKSITVEKYKSIKHSITIDLSDAAYPCTFIGKNGSGKSNLLRAVEEIFGNRSQYSRFENAVRDNYFTIQLDDKERKELDGIVQFDKSTGLLDVRYTDKQYDVFDRNRAWEHRVPFIHTGPVRRSVREYKDKANKLMSELLKKAEEYADKLKDVGALLKSGDREYSDGYGTVEDRVRSLKSDIRTLSYFTDELNKYETMTFEDQRHFYFRSPYNDLQNGNGEYEGRGWAFEVPEIYTKLSIAEERAFGDPQAVDNMHKKFKLWADQTNAVLLNLRSEILGYFKEIQVISESLEKLFSDDKKELEEQNQSNFEKYTEFLNNLGKCAGEVYFLDNEWSLMFGNDNNYRDKSTPITVLDGFLRSKKLLGKQSLYSPSGIDEERLKKCVTAVNKQFFSKIIPDFDKNEIQGLRLSFKNQDNSFHQLCLDVIEKDGSKAPFDQTSLGRRWYLTYAFIKSVLKSGDFLFLDEPAAFLHPSAVSEVRTELEDLAKKGVHVFISTHNAHMLSRNPENFFKNLFNVRMTENGSVIEQIKTQDDAINAVIGELGFVNFTDILFKMSEPILLCEGVTDLECIKKFAELLNYDISGYRLHSCDGEAIIQASYICCKFNIQFKSVLDNDNKFKGAEYEKNHSNYRACIETIESNPNCAFVGEGEDGQLEDLFKDKKKFFKDGKVDREKIAKIRSADQCEKFTLEKFEELFKKLGLSKLDKPEG